MRRDKLKTQMNRVISILAIALMASGVFTVILPASAHTPAWNIPTYAYVTASPQTVGVGEYTLIVAWLDKYPATAGGAGGDRWHGYQVTITKPDGTKDILPIPSTSAIASGFATYTPTQAGDYTMVFSWPGQTLTNGTGIPNVSGVAYVGDYFMPATSDPFVIHVQQTHVAQWPKPHLRQTTGLDR